MRRFLATLVALSLVSVATLHADDEGTVRLYNRALSALMEGSEIEVTSVGTADTESQAESLAIGLAQRRLVEIIHGVRIDSKKTIEDTTRLDDWVTTRASGTLQAAIDVPEKSFVTQQPSGKWRAEWTLRVPLNGMGIAENVGKILTEENVANPPKTQYTDPRDLELNKSRTKLQVLRGQNIELEESIRTLQRKLDAGVVPAARVEEKQAEIRQLSEQKQGLEGEISGLQGELEAARERIAALQAEVAQQVQNIPESQVLLDAGPYSGLIIDARGLNLKMAIGPQIYAASGHQVYSFINIVDSIWVSNGMVGYAKSVQEAERELQDRIGTKTLTIKANQARGDVHTDVIVSDAAAVAIFASNLRDHFLDRGSVVFVID